VLTVVDLLEDFGHTIYIATDLTAQQRMKEIQSLESIYYELAAQTKTPLSLALGWLDRLKKQLSDPSLQNMVDTSMQQLKKLELTYNRIAMYAEGKNQLPFNPTLLDLAEVIDAVRSGMPDSEQDIITWPRTQGETYIQGDLFQLRFCLETILSYLLRFIPIDDRIDMNVEVGDEQVVLTITGWLPRPTSSGAEMADAPQVAQAVADLAFGEHLIHQIIVIRHSGSFTVLPQKSDIAVFKIGLPLCGGGCHES